MSKVTKLIRHPIKFFRDARIKKRKAQELPSNARIPTCAFHFLDWKRNFYQAAFLDRDFLFFPLKMTAKEFREMWNPFIADNPSAEVFVWGMNVPPFLPSDGRKTYFIEDGFLRSVGLGAGHCPPFSITVDSQAPYFNAAQATDLEDLLATYNFAEDPELLLRAEKMMKRILETSVSKYNHSTPTDIAAIYGPKKRKRVLVIGQVETDASIKFGCERLYTNNDMVTIARLENRNAQVIYKPHPDVLQGKRNMLSNPRDVCHLCQILEEDVPLAQAFETVDHVYTITSLAGFEALFRNLKVTTLGCPFYAGWGLTDDRQPSPRRKRKLSVAEVFAAAYIVYPRYFDPVYKLPITPEQAVDRLLEMRELHRLRPANQPDEPAIPDSDPLNGSQNLSSLLRILQETITQVQTQLDKSVPGRNPAG